MVVAVGWVICEVIQIVADEVIAGERFNVPFRYCENTLSFGRLRHVTSRCLRGIITALLGPGDGVFLGFPADCPCSLDRPGPSRMSDGRRCR